MKVYDLSDTGLTEEEKQITEKIGKNHPDYCAAAVLDHRYPEKNVTYHESEGKMEIGGEKMKIDFELVKEVDDVLFAEDSPEYVTNLVTTMEMLFDLKDPVE